MVDAAPSRTKGPAMGFKLAYLLSILPNLVSAAARASREA
jgi:hypothetical protein